jgi:hypothetical protein
MATTTRWRLITPLAGLAVALVMACGGEASSTLPASSSAPDSSAIDSQQDPTFVTKPAGPASTATPLARAATVVPTSTPAASQRTLGGTTSSTPVAAFLAEATPAADNSISTPTSTPGGASVPLPTAEPEDPFPPTPIVVESPPQPVPSPTPTPSIPTPTPTPAPPTGPGSPDANVSRATQFVPLDQPRFVPAAQAQAMTSESIVLGLDWRGESRAYPLSMMWFHHIANDNIDGWPVLVTY